MINYFANELFDLTEIKTSNEKSSSCEKKLTLHDIQNVEKSAFDLSTEIKYSHMFLSII